MNLDVLNFNFFAGGSRKCRVHDRSLDVNESRVGGPEKTATPREIIVTVATPHQRPGQNDRYLFEGKNLLLECSARKYHRAH
jgi:hypothetical protein